MTIEYKSQSGNWKNILKVHETKIEFNFNLNRNYRQVFIYKYHYYVLGDVP
jgi:hypothetical protein